MRNIIIWNGILFWPLYYVSLEFSNTFITNVVLLILTLPTVIEVFFSSLKQRHRLKILPQHYLFIFILLISFHRLIFDFVSSISVISDLAAAICCFIFWFKIDKYIGSKKANLVLLLSSSIVLFCLILPQYINILFSGEILNAFKNVDFESVKFVKSTIEISLWLGIFISFVFAKKASFFKYFTLIILTILVIASGKRSLLIFFLLIFALTVFSFLRKKLFLISFAIPLLPLIFYLFSYSLLLLFSGNTFVYSLLVTTTEENFLTGSGRLLMWYDLIQIFFNFESSSIFNGPQSFKIWKYFEDEIYHNLHNAYLQIFYKRGYLLFIFCLFIFYKYLRELKIGFKNPDKSFDVRKILFLLIFTMSNTEAMLRMETSHFLIPLMILSLKNSHENKKCLQ